MTDISIGEIICLRSYGTNGVNCRDKCEAGVKIGGDCVCRGDSYEERYGIPRV
jgi:hypothetical protein